ncbi:helix-turn-helix domain-containing protein [Stutzerimonas kunmingensis]|uniref:helix-turn-helix domain-containing protein n=1 Tax=Stutzerimonas kunmingensis TaxID=1211807 RepID=UPI001F3E2EE4|nr:helix-turn-helix domain-containing protein [Stutzerimonas kunmingensis]MCF6754876.1 helix-turn-helix domain-containing protein [Stutzerimonas stutzeri]
MSIKISSLVWEHYPAGGCELLTALAYADHAHDDGTNIRPSVAYIARKTRQSERSVQRHLAQMRKSGWLLTVRYANGGRSFATEYRVNPLWISNPANLSPFAKEADETPTKQVTKDDSRGIQRVTPMSPQPPGTINEPKTGQGNNAPTTSEAFSASKQAVVQKLLQQCPIELQQLVLNEVSTRIAAGQVRNSIGLLRKLVELAQRGSFVPSAKPPQNLSGRQQRKPDQDRDRDPDKRFGNQSIQAVMEMLGMPVKVRDCD